MVEGGCDGFQPFKRRVWSTWLFGYRLTCVNWYEGGASQFEIVTAISEGATEGKAAQVAAGLDAQQLIQLCPPSATERVNGQAGDLPTLLFNANGSDHECALAAPLLSSRQFKTSSSRAAGIQVPGGLDGVHMWVKRGGKEVLEKVGVWVICCGIQADGPMRQLLNRCLGHAAERGCDCCGILAKKGVWNANKFLGCVTTCMHTPGGFSVSSVVPIGLVCQSGALE
jgi:hypothetical protein